ncbi:hypothetical protein Cfor_10826 [Coptotermes formosanus]|uniref:Leucine-rich repeat and WD repeat-containing protein 1 WD domain-containing protein n=1 Tax=Coptotermes formosanus TaxID=36987 RepID=A0A6L2PJ97_COPFO|nr:hypothetical protein Cfor_10826 [Coptotermes formosanus]
MKRKLVYCTVDDAPCDSDNSSLLPTARCQIDYEPTHFLRCHSRKNDPADIQTQVWQCVFEPNKDDPMKTANVVATCGGNSICLINVKTGEVTGKFRSKDLREMFYCIAWTTLFVELVDPPQMNILAAAGARGTLHLVHPDGGVAFFEHRIIRSQKVTVSSLLFHPKRCSILFCAMSDGRVLVWDIGSPSPPDYNTQINHLLTLEARLEIFKLIYSLQGNVLMAACTSGVCGWIVTQEVLEKKQDRLPMLKFQFPRKHIQGASETQLVDSLEVVGESVIATKCVLHGVIYLWDLKATLAASGEEHTAITVTPICVLSWSNTDNYFMNMGCHPEDKGTFHLTDICRHSVAGLLACGDDRGALWLYSLKEVLQKKEHKLAVQPMAILDWPDITDLNLDRNRKLRLDVYDIVVDSVAVSCTGKYLVAVTNNNMVCIWKRMEQMRS